MHLLQLVRSCQLLARWKFSRHINSWFCEGGDLAKKQLHSRTRPKRKVLTASILRPGSFVLHPSSCIHAAGAAEACVRARTENWNIFSALRVCTLHPSRRCIFALWPTGKWHGIRFFNKNLQRLCIFASPSPPCMYAYVFVRLPKTKMRHIGTLKLYAFFHMLLTGSENLIFQLELKYKLIQNWSMKQTKSRQHCWRLCRSSIIFLVFMPNKYCFWKRYFEILKPIFMLFPEIGYKCWHFYYGAAL